MEMEKEEEILVTVKIHGCKWNTTVDSVLNFGGWDPG
jgi:hypothetical protein